MKEYTNKEEAIIDMMECHNLEEMADIANATFEGINFPWYGFWEVCRRNGWLLPPDGKAGEENKYDDDLCFDPKLGELLTASEVPGENYRVFTLDDDRIEEYKEAFGE